MSANNILPSRSAAIAEFAPFFHDCVSTHQDREKLILEYQQKAKKIGHSMLRRWHSYIENEEFDSIVNLSLCEATYRFNPNRGTKFITFLFYYLKGNLIKSVAQAKNNCISILGDQSTENSKLLAGGGLNELARLETTEALNGRECETPYTIFEKKELIHSVNSICYSKLSSLERDIILRIFIYGQQLVEIAAELGYSRCHISRIKKKALDELNSVMSAYIKDSTPRRKIRRTINRHRPYSQNIRAIAA